MNPKQLFAAVMITVSVIYCIGFWSGCHGGMRARAQELELVSPLEHKPGPHKFGVDLDKLNREPQAINWHPDIIRAAQKWADMPDKIVDAAAHAAYWSGLSACLVCFLIVVLFMNVLAPNARGK